MEGAGEIGHTLQELRFDNYSAYYSQRRNRIPVYLHRILLSSYGRCHMPNWSAEKVFDFEIVDIPVSHDFPSLVAVRQSDHIVEYCKVLHMENRQRIVNDYIRTHAFEDRDVGCRSEAPHVKNSHHAQ